MGWDYYGGYSYTSVADLKAKAKKIIDKAKKNGEEINPVEIQGRVIAKSWWGKAWCENLERYADYSSRLERGRKYVRSNTVVDLKIESGWVYSRVIGSRSSPYRTQIKIDELDSEQYEKVSEKCSKKIENLDALINGNFPEDLKEIFFEKGVGLFPSIGKIHFSCSCPDSADMCKHVAASLYGVGARFDKDPLLFFRLRGIDTEKLIGKAIENKLEKMLDNAEKSSSRIIDENEITQLFGI